MQELQRDLTAKGVVWLLVNSVSPTYPRKDKLDVLALREILARKGGP